MKKGIVSFLLIRYALPSNGYKDLGDHSREGILAILVIDTNRTDRMLQPIIYFNSKQTILPMRQVLLLLPMLLGLTASAQSWSAPTEVYDPRGTSGDIGKYNSMAIVNGYPAVATYDVAHSRILYMRAADASGTVWNTPISVNAPAANCTSLSLQEVNGKPAIAFVSSELYYVHATDADGLGWGTTVLVDSLHMYNAPLSMKVVNGRPAIAYRCFVDNFYNELRYVRANDADGTSWGTPVWVYGLSVSVVVLEVVNGNPAIGFMRGDYARFVRSTDANGTAWGSVVDAFYSTSLANLSMTVVNGIPAFAVYYDPGLSMAYVRALNVNGTSWSAPSNVTGGFGLNAGLRLQLLDMNGTPAVAYFEYTNLDLYFIRANSTDGATWAAPQLLDAPGYVGTDISAVMVNSNPAIAYRDETNGDLKITRASTTTGSGAWNPAYVLDGSPSVGAYTSQCIVDGFPALAYYDEDNGDLRYIRALDSTGTTWGTSITIDSVSNVGKAAEMIIVNGMPAIAYVDLPYGVKYVRANDALGTSWGTPVIVSGGATWVGYISMAIIAGRPAMALGNTTGYGEYRRANDADGTTWGSTQGAFGSGDLELLEINGLPAGFYFLGGALALTTGDDADGTTWSYPSVVIDATTSNGFHMDVQLVNGNPAVSYFHAGEELRYVRANDALGATWGTPVTVDATGYSGFRSSLAVVDGNPAIAYFDDLSDDLRYVRAIDATGTSWDTPVVLDSYAQTGEYPSMVVNGSHVGIAYFNRHQGYAYFYSGTPCTAVPAAPTNTTPAGNLEVCAGGSTILSASGTGTISWYSAVSGGSFLGSGETLFTGSLSADQVYYAQDSTCTASIRTLVQVTVADAINTALSVSENSITAVETSATYQWIDCLNGSAPIPNATGQTYNAPVSGSYAVIVTVNACSDTSACEAIITTGVDIANMNGYVQVFPNPAQRTLSIRSGSSGVVELSLLDATGRMVRNTRNVQPITNLDVSNLPRGCYALKVVSGTSSTTDRVVLE